MSDDRGSGLGYRDLLTGSDHLEHPGRRAEFTAAVRAWQEATADGVRPPRQRIDPPGVEAAVAVDRVESASQIPKSRSQTPAEETWEDLTERRAGAMARERAVALQRAAPLRTFVARVLRVHTDERAWRIGADGERKVAQQLERLARKDPQWRFLHAVPVGDRGSDIDHLVVGPGGVFTLNAKHHPEAAMWISRDSIRVNGRHQPYIRNSRHEAARAGRLLSAACGFDVPVTGVVVPVGARALVIKAAPIDVHVVNRQRLGGWLRERPAILTNERIAAIFDTARRSTTRQGRP